MKLRARALLTRILDCLVSKVKHLRRVVGVNKCGECEKVGGVYSQGDASVQSAPPRGGPTPLLLLPPPFFSFLAC